MHRTVSQLVVSCNLVCEGSLVPGTIWSERGFGGVLGCNSSLGIQTYMPLILRGKL